MEDSSKKEKGGGKASEVKTFTVPSERIKENIIIPKNNVNKPSKEAISKSTAKVYEEVINPRSTSSPHSNDSLTYSKPNSSTIYGGLASDSVKEWTDYQ